VRLVSYVYTAVVDPDGSVAGQLGRCPWVGGLVDGCGLVNRQAPELAPATLPHDFCMLALPGLFSRPCRRWAAWQPACTPCCRPSSSAGWSAAWTLQQRWMRRVRCCEV